MLPVRSNKSIKNINKKIIFPQNSHEDILSKSDFFKKYLSENYKDNFKTLSFLLYNDHGFKQAPYETISKDLYEVLIEGIEPITSVSVNEKDFEILDCDNGSCPVK